MNNNNVTGCRKFENVYVGWGHKYSVDNFNPALPEKIMDEYPSGPEITEVEDPTPEEENALKAQMEEAQEEEEEEPGDGDDDEDD